MISTLLVDDEPVARSILREELEPYPDIKIVGEADNGREAVDLINDLRPDLVFLDLQMPLLSGFDVIRALAPDLHPVVVFVTAYDSHAIEAFETGAIDYLVKPFGPARLQRAVERAKQLCGSPRAAAEHMARLIGPERRRIVGRSGGDYVLLDLDNVIAFRAERELVWIITADKRYLADQSLRALEQSLRDPRFRRVHRNALINVDHIRTLSAASSRRWLLTLSNRQSLLVSKRRASGLRAAVGW